MPPRRKVDLIPSEFRHWIQDELKSLGFKGYLDLTERLNFRLEEEGLEIRLGKSAVHAYGQEFLAYAKMQEQAQDEIRAFLEEASMKQETDVAKALFQQLTVIQWRLQMAMTAEDGLPDPRGMKDLTTALNNLIRSTSLRDAIIETERERLAKEVRKEVAASVEQHATELGLSSEVVDGIKREVLGVKG